jgi:2-polyprenyl-3-methyl-5-hydroxy-6-metoxy-1,4-benzoquinol methylase
VPTGCDRALDVGCGAGLFAQRLGRYARSVVAIDRDPDVIAQARLRSAPNVRYVTADFADHDLGGERYDFIVCIASIHHMPFAETVTRLRAALAPGGVLAIVGCYRQASPADYALDVIAIPANFVANMVVRRGASISTTVMDPQATLPEIKDEARRLLPGAVIRRRLYWRYTLVYRR